MMRRYLVFFPVFAVALPSNGLRAVQEGSIAIVGGTLVDVRSGEERKDIAVLVREGRIAEVGTTGNVTVPKDTAIIDARGKWILPGLIDMHSHVSDVDIETLPLQLYLANGVTTIRDPGGSVTAARLAQHQIETGRDLRLQSGRLQP
jgi:imidazolonepropionase-like amidohydrolase